MPPPVVYLHTVETRIQIDALEGNALHADRSDSEVRSHVAVLAHAETLGRIAQPNEARQELRLRRVLREGINDPAEVYGSGRLGTSCHSMQIISDRRKNVSMEIRGKFRRNPKLCQLW